MAAAGGKLEPGSTWDDNSEKNGGEVMCPTENAFSRWENDETQGAERIGDVRPVLLHGELCRGARDAVR